MNLFEQAVRNKFRFDTPQGWITAEDLFDLPLTSKNGRANLDDIAKGLHQKIKQSDDNISFVTETKSDSSKITAQFELVKAVITTKLAEKAARDAEAERSAKRQRILALIDQKQDQKLAESSLEELHKLLEQV